MEYLNAKQIIGRLKQGKVMDISEAYYSQLVRDGYLPFHKLPKKRRKVYLYAEVKQALLDMRDPSRDPQREAIQRKKDERKKAQKIEEEKEELQQHYENVIGFMNDIGQLTEDKYKEILLDDRDLWEFETLDECYAQDKKTMDANELILRLIDDYLNRIPKKCSTRELALVIKEILVYPLLDQDFMSINLDKLKKGGEQNDS